MPHADVRLSDIPFDSPFVFKQDDQSIVIVRTDSGISAFEDVCPHAFWPLSDGCVRDGMLECPGHGWEFDVRSGKCVNAPAYALTPVSTAITGEMLRLEWSAKTHAAKA